MFFNISVHVFRSFCFFFFHFVLFFSFHSSLKHWNNSNFIDAREYLWFRVSTLLCFFSFNIELWKLLFEKFNQFTIFNFRFSKGKRWEIWDRKQLTLSISISYDENSQQMSTILCGFFNINSLKTLSWLYIRNKQRSEKTHHHGSWVQK